MTSPAESPPTDPTPASQATRPLRELAAIVLLGANAVFLFVGLIQLVTPQGAYSTLTSRAGVASAAFIGLEAVVLPVLAVLLATHVAPVVPRAKLITQVALGEYAFSAVVGGLALLVWLVGRLAEGQLFVAMTGILTRVAWAALFAMAAYLVWSVWQRLYHVPRPKPEPGLYGSPQPGWPGGPTQPGWSQPGGPGGAGQPGAYGAGQPGAYGTGQPGAYGTGQPGGYGDRSGWPAAGQPPMAGGPSASPHTWPPHGQPAVPPQPSAPATPQPSAQATPQPAAPPFGQPASADPTQAIPRQGAEPT
ncbi:hypothetical protein, partial [Micromonospora qiuiae]|uniref:hypothetical protein n=1 Tax=Micromonospora qiuiae TaxID=502268 RepID=UPI00194EAFC5